MKKIEAYQCEKCSKLHDSTEKAEMCEALHAKDIEVETFDFSPGKQMPESVTLTWTRPNGEKGRAVYYHS